MGPNYAPPEVSTASQWIDYQDPRVSTEEQALGEWWRVFNDPVLNRLIETACDQNLTLRQAGARIAEARAVRGIAAGNLFPQTQEAAGGYSTNKTSEETANAAPDSEFQQWDAGFNLSWELDFWGRYRRANESADAVLDASLENYDDVLVILLSDVASTYVQYRTLQTRLEYARQNVAIQEAAHQLAQDKFLGGIVTERDAQQARQVLEQTRALIPQLETSLRQTANALCTLLGTPPHDLTEMLGPGEGIPTTKREVAAGIPADLVRRRPDVRRAERQVAAQSALIGVAKADLYPRISLVGSISVQAEDFSGLGDTPDSLAGFIGPSFRWNILNYGRIENAVRVEESRFEQLVLVYQQSVLVAGQEAEDALVAFLKTQQQAEHLSASVEAARRTVEITSEQYREGAVDFTPLFLFQSTLVEQEDQLASVRGNIALSLISLYRSLGGGWDVRSARGEQE